MAGKAIIRRLKFPARRTDPHEEGRAKQAEINRQLRAWPPRRIASWSLMILGVVIAAQHLFAHAGFRPAPLSMGWQDLLMGYPAAAMLALIGAIMIDPRPHI